MGGEENTNKIYAIHNSVEAEVKVELSNRNNVEDGVSLLFRVGG